MNEDQPFNGENQSTNEENEENKENFFELEENQSKAFDEIAHLKCSICHQICSQPKFLSCFHSFCFQCIQKIIDKDQFNEKDLIQIRCPTCEQITRVRFLVFLI